MTTLNLLYQIFVLHPIFWSFMILNLTWIYFCAIMRLQQVRALRLLEFKKNPVRWVFAYGNLPVGLVLDIVTNVLFSPFFLEMPQWQNGEFLLTQRLCRHYVPGSNDWRSKFAGWIGDTFLNDIDPSGAHVT